MLLLLSLLHKSSRMADEHEHDTTFESADAGASETFPMQAGSIRKNGFIAIKGRPCKVLTTALAARLRPNSIQLLLPDSAYKPYFQFSLFRVTSLELTVAMVWCGSPSGAR